MVPKMRIRTKILGVFLGLFLLALVLFGYIALNNIKGVGNYALKSSSSLGDYAVNDSTSALERQAEEYLLRLVRDQALISNTLFEKVEAEVHTMAGFAATQWSNRSSFTYRPSHSQEDKPEDVYASSVYVLAPGVVFDEMKEETNEPVDCCYAAVVRVRECCRR